MTFTLEQAKAQLEALIARSAAGEEVVITRDGRALVRMVAAGIAPNGSHAPEALPQRLGWGKGLIASVSPDFDEPLEDFGEYTR